MSATQVELSLDHPGVYHTAGVSKGAAVRASNVLQENHDNHHIFFNPEGFHNHIAHHILTLYAIGATPDDIQRHYEDNKTYQIPPRPIDKGILEDLNDYEKFQHYLGKGEYYNDYLLFFQAEIDKKGFETVITDYCLKHDKRASDMLVRLHAGFLHPMIHLGFGIEFKQPAIIAEALAETAVHDDWIGPFFLETEKAAATTDKGKSIVELLDEVRADRKLSTAADWNDANKIRDGIMVRAPEKMIKYASQWKVTPDQLVDKTAEMTNAAIYYTGGAQNPPKQVKFDFYYMHCVNCSIFYHTFLDLPWISDENKARLLEWKGRLDLCMYASRRSPEPLIDEIVNYKPKRPADKWDDIFLRARKHEDDGHCCKLVRAIAHGEKLCEGYDADDPRFRIKGDMWLQLGHMAIDSVEDSGNPWVRSAGFPQAWENFKDRPRAQL
ncbi:hypothetical protein ACLMJK_001259 [Lecanora helva]